MAGLKTRFYDFIQMIGFGTTLMKLGFHKMLPFFGYLFLLSMISIFLSYKTDQAMLRAEQSREALENAKIHHAQKTCEYVGLDRISTVEEMLKAAGSEVKAPEKPANIIR
jgi:hypothetical protein